MPPCEPEKRPPALSKLRLTDTQEALKIIKRSQGTACDLDSLATGMLKETLEIYLPHPVEIINASFTFGTFPEEFKTAAVRPLLKKPTLNKDIYKTSDQSPVRHS